MAGLIISVSGIRGIVGESLGVDETMRFARAYAEEVCRGTILVGTDGRPSGEALKHAAIAGLLAGGCQAIDIGVVPTPTMGVAVKGTKALGGIQITASHNPAPYNGLKLFGADGRVIPAPKGERIKQRYLAGSFDHGRWNQTGRCSTSKEAARLHLERILEVTPVDAIRAKKWKVLVDANGGAGGPLAQMLLDSLGVETVMVGGHADGNFLHEPEPNATNLAGIGPMVKAAKVHAAFVLDPDADRLALFDEHGTFLGEELTLALAFMARLQECPGPVVVNMSTSLASESVARKLGQLCHRSAVGEANVVDLMISQKAVIGGEGNGGVIDPRIGWVRDPFIGMALILGLMTRENKSLGQLAKSLDAYQIHKDKLTMDTSTLQAWYQKVLQRFPDASVDQKDGLRLSWDNQWVHLRPSNTEPIVRIITEALSEKQARELAEACRELAKD